MDIEEDFLLPVLLYKIMWMTPVWPYTVASSILHYLSVGRWEIGQQKKANYIDFTRHIVVTSYLLAQI